MANRSIPPLPSRSSKSSPDAPDRTPENSTFRNLRETIESIVIAFVLAFLFRTFEAEAFVIPTGSMAPTLQGRHKDVTCEKCGYRFQASASEEEGPSVLQLRAELSNPHLNPDQRRQIREDIASFSIATATCPNCRWTTVVDQIDIRAPRQPDFDPQPSFNGDRILVSKLAYQYSEPSRWDVVVFKYPGEGKQNYIKRLIGLPGETIQIQNGDIHIKNRQGGRGARDLDTFTIERKPPSKVLALKQVVHDSEFDSAELNEAGWPLRWSAFGPDRQPADANAAGQFTMALETGSDPRNVQQVFSTDGTEAEAWIRYQHTVPDSQDWARIEANATGTGNRARPRLITDFYAYNSEVKRRDAFSYASPIDTKLGMNWVGDLLLQCDVEVRAAQGSLVLELVEAGRHFQCEIDLKQGQVTVAIDGQPQQSVPAAMNAPGTYQLRMANVDDQLILWIDDTIVDLGGEEGTFEYDAVEVFGGGGKIAPQSTPEDPGDLAPVGIAARNAQVVIKHLKIMRDVYYIADEARLAPRLQRVYDTISEYDIGNSAYREILESVRRGDLEQRPYLDFVSDPSKWDLFASGRVPEFALRKLEANPEGDQFFVLGDNSPSSKDSRLWSLPDEPIKKPGGPYVERRLMTGRALFVYWPHSWDSPVPFFPNFRDMRLIR